MKPLLTLALAAAVLTACRDGARPIGPVADVAASSTDAASPSAYESIVLDLPGSGPGFAVSINNHNQVVAYNRTAKDGVLESTRAFLWDNGVIQELGTLGAPHTVPTDINEGGQVVGWARTDFSTAAHAFFWDHGVMQDLGEVVVSGGPQPVFNQIHINERGQVIGNRPGGQAFLWENGVTQVVPLDFAADLNDRGQVAGYVWHDNAGVRRRHAAVWESGTLTQLGTLGGDESWANAVSNSGWVVGGGRTAPNEFGSTELHAFRWRDGLMEDLGRSGQMSSGRPEGWQGHLVNAPGQIGARSFDVPFFWERGVTQAIHCRCASWYLMDLNVHGALVIWGGFVWADGVLHALSDVATRAIAMNDRGTVVGYQLPGQATIWVPVAH